MDSIGDFEKAYGVSNNFATSNYANVPVVNSGYYQNCEYFLFGFPL